jgi:hypothetical protein
VGVTGAIVNAVLFREFWGREFEAKLIANDGGCDA